MKKFLKISSKLTKPVSFLASKFGKKKHSVNDDLEEVSDLPDSPMLDVENGVMLEDVVQQASGPIDESLADPLQKMEIFENRNQNQTLLLNKTDEVFSSPSYNPDFENPKIRVLESKPLNESSVNTIKVFEMPNKSYPLFKDGDKKKQEYAMQKKVDDLEKVSEQQANEINSLKSLLNDCLSRISSLEGELKGNKSNTINSFKLASPKAKDVQLRKPLTSPRTSAKVNRLSGAPTRRSTSDLAKQPWRPPGGIVIYPIVLKKGRIHKRQSLKTQKMTNQLYNQLSYATVKKSRLSKSWRPPGISVLFCNFNYNIHIDQDKPKLSLTNTENQVINKTNTDNTKEATFVKGEGILRIFIRGRPINLYIPSTIAEGFDIKSQIQEPNERLRMEWVYGYRGKDCRKNLYYLPTGDLVYFVAGIVVLTNLKANTQRHYVEHTDDIKCLALHPDKVIFASGQVAGHSKTEGKPHVRVWNSSTLQTLQIIGLGFFERAISALGFSKSDGGKLLCTVDEANDHNLTVWNWTVNKSVCTSKSSTEPVIEAEFNPTDNNVIVTCGKNHLAFWIIEKGNLIKKMAIFEKYEKPKFVTCVVFTSNGDLISGDSSGNIFLWSKEKRSISSTIMQAHNGPIFSLLISKNGTLISGGGKDRMIIEWDLNTKEKSGRNIQLTSDQGCCRVVSEFEDHLMVGTTNNGILEITANDESTSLLNGHFDEVWGISSHPSSEKFISSGHDRKIIVWDAITHNVLLWKQIEKNIQSICINYEGTVLAVGCLEGYWFIYDAKELNNLFQGRDGNEPIQCCEFSPDNSHLALGSRDNFIYMYKVNSDGSQVTKVGKCSGHSSFITHIDWSSDGQYLRSNSGDYELLFWKTGDCKQITSPSTLSDVKWQTCNCTLSLEVAGIWPEGSDGTDINAVARAHDRPLAATADDFGKVNLYRYPSYTPKAAHKAYRGHSSHVTGVTFLADDQRLISAGGQDTAIIQWALI